MLQNKTFELAAEAIELVKSFPRGIAHEVVAKQFVRAATSTAANYRAAIQARFRPEFLSKINIVLEEADETRFWLELRRRTHLVQSAEVISIYGRADEVVAMALAARQTTRHNESPEKDRTTF
ncbi:MAG: four helix bundle protein [Verrucomicrobia bacterium]|nr:four helix bundle protein [Verrucomicrobiota bacterium]